MAPPVAFHELRRVQQALTIDKPNRKRWHSGHAGPCAAGFRCDVQMISQFKIFQEIFASTVLPIPAPPVAVLGYLPQLGTNFRGVSVKTSHGEKAIASHAPLPKRPLGG